MLSLVSRLFNHYCDHHFTVPMAGFPVFDGQGKKLGHVDRLSFGRASLRIEGWSTAEKVALGRPAKTAWQRPDIKRPDVNIALSLTEGATTGFNLVWHGSTQGLLLSFKSRKATLQLMCPVVGRWDMLKAQLHIRFGFMKSVMRASPVLMRAYFAPNAVNKSRAKRALGMRDTQLGHILDAQFFGPSQPVKSSEKLTIVMPVFNAFDVLCEALERVKSNTDLPWRLILVEDCSTDKRVLPMLRDWVKRQRSDGAEIELFENAKNLGFIGSVNRAFKHALTFKDHVVLLNSDALVPPGWARRLIYPITRNARIASVTPLSNDAEIFTAPTLCKRFDTQKDEACFIDTALSNAIASKAYKPAPTGVGFCMALNNKFLRKIPEFDTAFGKGYGEEVDWCQRVKRLGGEHVVQPNLFVEHRGGTSFGSVEKQAAIARNNQTVSKRYPEYDQSVQNFMATDPIRTARVLSACALLFARQDNVAIYIGHSLGGGAEMYLQDEIKARLNQGEGSVVLRVGGALRWRIEVHLTNGVVYGDTDDDVVMKQFLTPVRSAKYIYSCAVGDPDPLGLTRIILDLVKETDSKLTFLIHDFFAASPSYCLMDSDGVHRPEVTGGSNDRAHVFKGSKGKLVDLKAWRKNWFEMLCHAEKIVCFSQSSADIIRACFPSLATDFTIVPHDSKGLAKIVLPLEQEGMALGVLGDIGIQKGAGCLEQLSRKLPMGTLKKLVVVGRLDPRFCLGKADIETGSYKRADITPLAQQNRVAAWFIPSIWPETFSYTTHEALSTGLPVFCFDLGAQGEAVRRAPNGYALPLAWAENPERILLQITEVLENDAIRRRVHSSVKKPWHRGAATRLKSAS